MHAGCPIFSIEICPYSRELLSFDKFLDQYVNTKLLIVFYLENWKLKNLQVLVIYIGTNDAIMYQGKTRNL